MKRFIKLAVCLSAVCVLATGCNKPSESAAKPTPTPAPASPQDRAVSFVESLGGEVTRDDKAPGKPVVGVKLSETQVTDAGLKDLAPLTKLTHLALPGTAVTDAGVEKLRKALPKCQILE